MNRTKIEYVDYTWNPVTGCTKGCEYCYARRLANGRLKKHYWDNPEIPDDDTLAISNPFTPRYWSDRIHEPFQIKTSKRILVCSMGDLFDTHIPDGWIANVLEVAEGCPQHTFLFLTKQPQRMAQFEFPDNAWVGRTITRLADMSTDDTVAFRSIKAGLKFVSFEPLLGRVGLHTYVDWVIVGAMTGANSIQPDRRWVREILDMAEMTGIPVFLKDNLHWPERRQEWPKEEGNENH